MLPGLVSNPGPLTYESGALSALFAWLIFEDHYKMIVNCRYMLVSHICSLVRGFSFMIFMIFFTRNFIPLLYNLDGVMSLHNFSIEIVIAL